MLKFIVNWYKATSTWSVLFTELFTYVLEQACRTNCMCVLCILPAQERKSNAFPTNGNVGGPGIHSSVLLYLLYSRKYQWIKQISTMPAAVSVQSIAANSQLIKQNYVVRSANFVLTTSPVTIRFELSKQHGHSISTLKLFYMQGHGLHQCRGQG